MERINALLQQVADRGDEIKDLRTRHELTVKRNTEAELPTPPDLHPGLRLQHRSIMRFSLPRTASSHHSMQTDASEDSAVVFALVD